ncbi:MAG: NusG domain II-containing protein [Bacilli bacterium]|jgi:hypothetical protein|nr:NusG domain II-containing protein [Bacilli bacterium]
MDISLRKNKTDLFIVIIAAILVVFFVAINLFYSNSKDNIISVYYDNEIVHTMYLNIDEEYIMDKEEFPLLLDRMVIEVKQGRVRIKEEESPKHYCSIMGYQSQKGTSIICAPNSVMIIIEGYEDTGIDWTPGGAA